MPAFERSLPVLAFVAISAACGTSPTSPDVASAPTIVASVNSSTAAPLELTPTGGFAPPTACDVHGIVLNVVPSNDKVSRVVEATFKGDPAYCGILQWSASPEKTRLDVVARGGTRVVVYDPGGKFGDVDVTASFQPLKLTATLRITFPRTVR